MPDALSKTIPIWIAVINRLLFPGCAEGHRLRTPLEIVGRSEHAQIEACLDRFVGQAQALGLNVPRLRSTLSRPLMPAFACQSDSAPIVTQTYSFHPVICCSVSRQEVGDGDSYIQGSGDDTENWAHGLTPEFFWRCRDQLCAQANDEELVRLIHDTIGETTVTPEPDATLIKWTSPSAPIWLSTTGHATLAKDRRLFDAIIFCNEKDQVDPPADGSQRTGPRLLHLACRTGKLGSRDLRMQLPKVSQFVRQLRASSSLLISCQTGEDLAVGVALTILCQWYDEDGKTHCGWAKFLLTHMPLYQSSCSQCQESPELTRATFVNDWQRSWRVNPTQDHPEPHYRA